MRLPTDDSGTTRPILTCGKPPFFLVKRPGTHWGESRQFEPFAWFEPLRSFRITEQVSSVVEIIDESSN